MIEIVIQVPVNEFGVVVTIKSPEWKGECSFDALNGCDYPGFSFSPDGSLGSPARCNIDTVNSVDRHASHRRATMHDGIRLVPDGLACRYPGTDSSHQPVLMEM